MPQRARAQARWAFWIAGGLAALVVTYVLIVALVDAGGRVPVLDVLNTIAPFVAAVLCFAAARQARRSKTRWFWLFMGAAHATAFIAEAIWAGYELSGGVVPYPSPADIGWVAYYPLVLVAVAVLLSYDGIKRLSTATQSLDAIIFAVTAGALCWMFLVAPYFAAGDDASAEIANIGYSAGDMLLLVSIAAILTAPERKQLPPGLGWLTVSMLVSFVADVWFTLLTANDTYATGGWVDALWPVGYAVAAIGALTYLRHAARRRNATWVLKRRSRFSKRVELASHRVRVALPYLAVPAVGVMLAVRFLGQQGGTAGDIAVIGIAVALTALILVRQALVVVANQRLERSLQEASKELEMRVMERTEQLAVEKEHLALLGRIAADMSQCVDVKQVVTSGLRLAKKTAHANVAGLSLQLPGARRRFFGSAGLSRPGRLELLALADTSRPAQTRSAGEIISLRGVDLDLLLRSLDMESVFAQVDVIPLVARRSTLGVLCLGYSRLQPEGRNPVLTEGVASQLAVALENAWRCEALGYERAGQGPRLAPVSPLSGVSISSGGLPITA